jgi:hypothetical protein
MTYDTQSAKTPAAATSPQPQESPMHASLRSVIALATGTALQTKDEVTTQLTAMGTARRNVLIITTIVMVTSYQHQAHFFAGHGAGWASVLLPAPLDLLMLTLMKISQLKGVSAANRWVARGLLVLPAAGSGAVNFFAPGDLVLRISFASLVLAIAIGDVALGLIKPSKDAMRSAVRSTAARKAAATKAAAVQQPAAKKAPAAKPAAARKPRAPKVQPVTAAPVTSGLIHLPTDAEIAQITAGQLTA